MNQPLLQALGVTVERDSRVVLHPMDLAVSAGEVVCVYGPNGAGKSTLLQALAGLLPPASGRVLFHGKTVGDQVPLLQFRRRIAMVLQEPLLLRGSVWHNVTLGLRLRGVAASEQKNRADLWLERLKITHLAGRPAHALSAGEARRASLARALVLDPEVLFLDEPFVALDAPTRFPLLDELAAILTERRLAALFVTHDLLEALEFSEKCLILDQGRILQEGRLTDILKAPASHRVREITGPFIPAGSLERLRELVNNRPQADV